MNRKEWIDNLNLTGIGVEVGVQSGDYSKMILESSKLHLILVDSWRYLEDYPDKANVPTSNHLNLMNNTIKTLAPFEGRFTLMREMSVKAASFFPDNFFDFVYLDANHSEGAVYEDLVAWWPKVKMGGVFSGHDYVNLKDEINDFGVKSAVDKFFPKTSVGSVDNPFPTWYTYKPYSTEDKIL